MLLDALFPFDLWSPVVNPGPSGCQDSTCTGVVVGHRHILINAKLYVLKFARHFTDVADNSARL